MDLHLDPLIMKPDLTPPTSMTNPTPPVDPLVTRDRLASNWNEACLRLEDYLRSYRIQDQEHLLRLTFSILGEAREIHQRDPSSTPLKITLRLAEQQAGAWLARLSHQPDEPPLKQSAHGCVAYFVSGAHKQWPQTFLNPEVPAELLETVRQVSLEAGPAIDFTSLLRKEIDYGPMQTLSRDTWLNFSWTQVLRAFLLWLFVFFATYFIYTRFFL